MTITTRSQRVSVFGTTPTPAAVGPGAYAPEYHVSSFKNEVRPLYSGFATSGKRNLNANKTTSAMTPGPGAYLDSSSDRNPKTPSNIFATKISRFAPSAPGSSIYRASSIQDNPGPGAYSADPSPHPPARVMPAPRHSSNQQTSREDGREQRPMRVSVPTIPKKEQSYGYVEAAPGELRAQVQPTAIYSGIGQDTVGPAAYSSHASIWNEKKNVAPSLRSTVQRDVWQEFTPRRAVPGPGQYGSTSATKRKTDPPRQSAVFASKVPLLPDPKRAEHHDPDRAFELQAKEQRLQQQVRRGLTSSAPSPANPFGSTTGRMPLSSQLNAPFSKPSCSSTPGPGMYAPSTSGPGSGRHAHTRRHGSHRTRGSGTHEDQYLGFSSVTERYCLTQTKPSSSPGPGAYRSETPRTVEQTVQGKQTVGRFGVFGSNSERHVWAELARLNPDAITPGPGAYAATSAAASVSEEAQGMAPSIASAMAMSTRSAAFKSTSSRFSSAAHASPHVHRVGDIATPAVGEYNLTTSPAVEDARSPPSSARAPFLSMAERRVFDVGEEQDRPGPGQYSSPLGGLRVGRATATLPNEQRFRLKPTVPDQVGPGAYSIPGTVGTRSFNVTMGATTTKTSRVHQNQGHGLSPTASPTRECFKGVLDGHGSC